MACLELVDHTSLPKALELLNTTIGALAAERRAANKAMARGTLALRVGEQAAAGLTARLS